MDAEGFTKFIPSKNLYEQGDQAYLLMDDETSQMKLFFNSATVDKEKSKQYCDNVVNFINKTYSDKLESEVLTTGLNVTLLVKPKSSKNKTQTELSMDANKFMGLRRTPVKDGISHLVGSGWEYVDSEMDKNDKRYQQMVLILVDDNKKIVELSRGLNLEKSPNKEKLTKIAQEFAKKQGYEYKAI